MKKEVITVCAKNQDEANEIRKYFKELGFMDKYKLHVIISGNEDPAESLGSFLLS